MGEIRVVGQDYGVPPIWEPGKGEKIEMDPRYLGKPLSVVCATDQQPNVWIQIKFPLPVFDLHNRIYQNLFDNEYTFEHAVQHAVDMSIGSNDTGFLPSQTNPEKWRMLKANFLFACFPTGEAEKHAIVEARRSEFNRLASQSENCYGVFTTPLRVGSWQRFVALNKKHGADPYDQIEYLIRRGVGLVNSYDEHKENPVRISSARPSVPTHP